MKPEENPIRLQNENGRTHGEVDKIQGVTSKKALQVAGLSEDLSAHFEKAVTGTLGFIRNEMQIYESINQENPWSLRPQQRSRIGYLESWGAPFLRDLMNAAHGRDQSISDIYPNWEAKDFVKFIKTLAERDKEFAEVVERVASRNNELSEMLKKF